MMPGASKTACRLLGVSSTAALCWATACSLVASMEPSTASADSVEKVPARL